MGKERVVPTGFYLRHYGPKDPVNYAYATVIWVPPDLNTATCKYARQLTGWAWATLTWSCAPTKKQLAAAEKAPAEKEEMRYRVFDTLDELNAFLPVTLGAPT